MKNEPREKKIKSLINEKWEEKKPQYSSQYNKSLFMELDAVAPIAVS